MKKLQEKNRLHHSDDKSKEEQLRQRENGFQLYVNGAHNISSRRPSSVCGKRTARPCDLYPNPPPILSNHRTQWLSSNQIQIKTDEGAVITDIHGSSPSRNSHITYRLNVDQSWMPNWWYSQMQSPLISSLSLEDIPIENEQKRTYRLPNIGG